VRWPAAGIKKPQGVNAPAANGKLRQQTGRYTNPKGGAFKSSRATTVVVFIERRASFQGIRMP